MIALQTLSRVLLQHLITKLFGKTGGGVPTAFWESELNEN